jgi:hypothetical protein
VDRQVFKAVEPSVERAAEKEHVHLVVVEIELIDEGSVGERGGGVAEIRRVEAHLGEAVPLRPDFQQRLAQRERGWHGVDPRVGDDLAGVLIDALCGLIDLRQAGSADVECHRAGAAVVAGDDRPARGERAHAGKGAEALVEMVHQRVDVLGFFVSEMIRSDCGWTLMRPARGRQRGSSRVEIRRIVAERGQQVGFDAFGDAVHFRQRVTGRGDHGGEDLGLLALGQILGRGVRNTSAAVVADKVTARQAIRRHGFSISPEQRV